MPIKLHMLCVKKYIYIKFRAIKAARIKVFHYRLTIQIRIWFGEIRSEILIRFGNRNIKLVFVAVVGESITCAAQKKRE